ncbi:MAG: transporter substrate-binding domain-containing protein [Campylobacterales bacterium]|nr:transporter substrate-binding domain-containing protein [Campylobacterales bacterium]
MKKVMFIVALIHCTLYANTPSLSFSEEEKRYLQRNPVVRVCVNPTSPPFGSLGEKGKYEGIGAELLELIAKRLSLQLEIIQTYTWKESIEKAKNNQCDILNFIPNTLDFNDWLLFTEPIFSDYNVLLTRSDHPYIADVRSLSHKTLALAENTLLSEKLSYAFPNLTIFSVATPEDAIFLVLNQKIDMTVHSSTIMSYTFRKHELLNLKISATLEDFKNVFKIGVVGQNHILRDLLNKGISSLSEKERAAIVNKYDPIIFDPKIDQKVWYGIIIMLISASLVLLWNYLLRVQIKKEVAKNLLNQNIMTQQAKQAELGQLIGNISHQWREPLSNLSGINLMMLGLLEHKKRINRDFLYQKFKEVENTLDFMSQTMQNFLEFYKPSSEQKNFTIYDALQQTLSLVETVVIADKITITIDGSKEAHCFGIKNEFMQVWLNLINNSIRALQQHNIEKKIITIHIEEGRMTFQDNAKGHISQSDLSKGVGLNMCFSILKRYNKKLSFSNTQEGVCVTIEADTQASKLPPLF